MRKSIGVRLGAVAGVLVGCVLAGKAAASGGFDWEVYFPMNQSVAMRAETWEEGGPHLSVEADRGPLVSGTFQVRGRAVADLGLTPMITSVALYHGTDANSDGVLSASEWTLAKTAAASQVGNKIKAETSYATLAAGLHGYKVEVTYDDGTTAYDALLEEGIAWP